MTDGNRLRTLVRIEDYRPTEFAIDHVALDFDLGAEETIVSAQLAMRRLGGDAPLSLDGHGLELLEISIDGQSLSSAEYALTPTGLVVYTTPEAFLIETRVRIRPVDNNAGLGMFVAKGALLTQCETEGFRRLTYFLDRPDVLSTYSVRLEGDADLYPVLLSNGHPEGHGVKPNGRPWVIWRDPIPKPSYIFAVVAGRFVCQERLYHAASGRSIRIGLYADPRHAERCAFALEALENAMRWEEENWGAEYDLNVFNIVAADGFNSAMENKGLNLFAANELVTDPARTTDDEYASIEITIAHEYFHNLTGNRITVRDWFQKALKEGLTRFRDRTFSGDMGARDMRRLDFVSLLHREQFREDDGPNAHSVQPAYYLDTPDFVTMTIYDKGAELFRMMRTLAGAEGFRAATDLFVSKRVGTASRLEDFLEDYAVATGRDLTLFRRWFDQVGRPRLTVQRSYDAARRVLDLTISQMTPPTGGQPEKGAMHVPIVMSLRDREGRQLPGQTEQILELVSDRQSFQFADVPAGVVPSLLRGFSAPVSIEPFLTPDEFAALAMHDDDAFVRWRSIQQLGVLAIRERMQGGNPLAGPLYARIWGSILCEPDLHPGVKAHLLQVPAEPLISEGLASIDLDGSFAARRLTIEQLVSENETRIAQVRDSNLLKAYRPDPEDMAVRRLRNLMILLPCHVGSAAGIAAAHMQFATADNLTDQVAAFAALVEVPSERSAAVERSARLWAGNDAAMTHWHRVQAALQSPDTAEVMSALVRRPQFDAASPSLTRAVTFAFFRANRIGFHARSGAGYALLEEMVRARDAHMPERIHWLMPQILEWRRYDAPRQVLMRATLERLRNGAQASETLRDLCTRALAD